MNAADRDAAEREEWEALPIHYPFPLTDGSLARIILPKQLTADDAERLAAFVLSLTATRGQT